MPEKRFIPSRKRRSGLRDAKLIIIASEGVNTENRYFEDLANEYYNPRIHVKVLEHLDTSSSPEHILRLLDNFRKEFSLTKDYDELWLVIDEDRWGSAKLSTIAKLCGQKNYNMAVSTPCFELWLLIHHKPLSEYSDVDLEEFRANRKSRNRTRLERELSTLLNGYDKSNLNTALFIPLVQHAITEGRRLDIYPTNRWQNELGSRVYLIAERIYMP